MGVGVEAMAGLFPTNVAPSIASAAFCILLYVYVYIYIEERCINLFTSLPTADRAISELISALSLQTEVLWQPNKPNNPKPVLCNNTVSRPSRQK